MKLLKLTCHQPAETLIYMFKELTRVNAINIVSHLVDPTRIFSSGEMVRTSVQEKLRMRKKDTN